MAVLWRHRVRLSFVFARELVTKSLVMEQSYTAYIPSRFNPGTMVHSEVQDRVMLTGRHMVRDVSCKNCDAKLGWVYEFATDDNQRYKEGRVILERALVSETDGMGETI